MVIMDPSVSFEMSHVWIGYDKTWALRQINCALTTHRLIALTGPNGGGKTSFLQCLASMIPPTKGTLKKQPASTIAYLPQRSTLARDFPITVWDLLTMGLWRETGPFQGLTPSQEHRQEEALELVGLRSFKNRSLHELSGGQFQRALFARLYLQNDPILLLDEPFTGIDQATQKILLKILDHWHQQGKTILVALHDLDLVQSFFQEALLISGTLLYQGPASDLTKERYHDLV